MREAERLIDPEFWADKRVLLTGHTGFKGSWLSTWLLKLRARLTGYALPPADDPSLFQVLGLADRLDHQVGDVRDLATLRSVMERANPEIVIHMAAQPLVRESYRDPVATYATNVMGTVHVLEAAHDRGGVNTIMIVTSDKCYENREWVWGYRENDRLGGRDPYSSSKAAAELVASAYRMSYFDDEGPVVATVRAGNVIGGGDWSPDRLVPDAMRAFSRGRPLKIRHPQATRPWQHVLEPLRGYLLLCQLAATDRARAAQAFNFGPDDDDVATVGALLGLVCEDWGDGASWEVRPDAALHEATELRLDSSKARREIGWRPRSRLPEAVRMSLDFYRAFYRGESRAALTDLLERQIAAAMRVA